MNKEYNEAQKELEPTTDYSQFALPHKPQWQIISEAYLSDLRKQWEKEDRLREETLRDQFAMAALSGLITDRGTLSSAEQNVRALPILAYDYADSMLEARKAKSK